VAHSISKRKKPSRDDYVLKEERKLESEVFDHETLRVLAKIMKKGIIATVDFPLNTGKEANVFRATTPDGTFLAIKIYKMETAPFLRKIEYIEGDPRFKGIKKNDRELVLAFARKEFKNLKLCEEAGVNAPRVIYLDKNVLIMSFVGEKDLAYPNMNQAPWADEKDLDSILNDIRKMYRAGLVHADISEYNILASKPPVLIDFGQGVTLAHNRAMEYLERDVRNILSYFEKKGIRRDFVKTLEWIKKDGKK
jgi:RIO kinase 1